MKKITRPWSFIDFAKYVVPSILSIMSISLYMMVDGIFISRFVGAHGMAAVNIIMPIFGLLVGIAIMVAAGGSALVGIEIGAGNKEKAKEFFSLLASLLAGASIVIPIGLYSIGLERMATLLGASEVLLPFCRDYLQAFLLGLAVVMLQLFYEFFIRLDGKPLWALALAFTGGFVNLSLDYLLIVVLDMGVTGAGYASAAGVGASVLLGTYYFLFHGENLGFIRPQWNPLFLWKTVVNGCSELITECSTAIKTVAFNYVILRYADETGVAAMAIMMYLYFLFSSFHLGLSMGIQPLISVNYGAKNHSKIKEIVQRAVLLSTSVSLVFGGIALFLREEIVNAFAKGQDSVVAYADHGLAVLSVGVTVCFITILASGFFTSVGNGKISAIISFCNSFVLTLGFIYIFPKFFGVEGVWWVIPTAEIGAASLSLYFLWKTRKRYFGQTELT